MWPPVDIQAAGSTDTLAAIVVINNRFLTFGYEFFVQYIQHFQEGAVGRNIFEPVVYKLTSGISAPGIVRIDPQIFLKSQGLKAAFGLLCPQDEDGTPTKPINPRQAASGE